MILHRHSVMLNLLWSLKLWLKLDWVFYTNYDNVFCNINAQKFLDVFLWMWNTSTKQTNMNACIPVPLSHPLLRSGFQQYTQVWQVPCKVTYGSFITGKKKSVGLLKALNSVLKYVEVDLFLAKKKKNSSLSTMFKGWVLLC